MYRCAKCGKKVMILAVGVFVRFCGHTKAAVIAEMKASMEGRGGLR